MSSGPLPVPAGERLLRPREASERLGVRPPTLAAWARADRIHPVRTASGRRLYPQAEVDRLLDAMTEAGQ